MVHSTSVLLSLTTAVAVRKAADLYKRYNQELPTQSSAAADVIVLDDVPPTDDANEEDTALQQTEDELEASLTAAMHMDLTQSHLPLDWAADSYQCQLDIELQYDLEAAVWDGQYITLEAEPEIPVFGNDEEAIGDVNHTALYARLTQSSPLGAIPSNPI
ncbi:hypothetical protein WJX77_012673 [Trebouxia sp. C0004]